jgi:hypothetical protein
MKGGRDRAAARVSRSLPIPARSARRGSGLPPGHRRGDPQPDDQIISATATRAVAWATRAVPSPRFQKRTPKTMAGSTTVVAT